MNKKGLVEIVLPSILVLAIATLLIFSLVDHLKQLDKNEEEIGLRIDNGERDCYDFCDGDYYYVHNNGGFFSADTTDCECKKVHANSERGIKNGKT